MKNKRKIKVPAAAYGIETNYGLGIDYADLLRRQGNAYTRMNNFQLGMLNKDQNAATNFTQSLNNNYSVNTTNGNVRQHSGNFDFTSVMNGLPDIVNTLSIPFQKSTATSKGEVAAQSVADVASGVSTGFKTAGLPGAIIGGTTALIGRDGVDPSQIDFVNYEEGASPTGVKAMFGGYRSWKKKLANVKRNTYNNRAAVQGTNYLQNEAYDESEGMNILEAANGGVASSVVLGDAGEYYKTPDGDIRKIKEDHSPKDSHPRVVEDGTKFLSDTLKAPGTNKTWSKLFEGMAANKKSKFNDRFAENAAKLNNMNNNMLFDLLFALQEADKLRKGIKPKYKQLTLAFDGGGVSKWSYGDDFKYLQNGKYDEGYLNWIKTGLTQDILDRALNQNPQMFSRFRKSNRNYKPTVQEARTWATDYKPSDFHKFAGWMYDNRESLQSDPALTAKHPELLDARNDKPAGLISYVNGEVIDPTKNTPISKLPLPTIKVPAGKGKPDKNVFNWSSALSGITSLAPIMSNLFTGDPEVVDAVYNPYATSITNTMRRRRFNIDPAIQDVIRNRAISRYNIGLMNTSTGANLAHSLQSAVNTNRAIANLRSMESNANNQYLADYANTMNNLGQQWVGATNLAADLNAQNRATARNIRRAGLSKLSELAQYELWQSKLRDRDNMMAAAFYPLLKSAYDTSTMDRFNYFLKQGGNYVG